MKKRTISFILSLALLAVGIPVTPSASVKAAETTEIIVDNQDAETNGSWSTGTSRSGKYGSDYSVGAKDSSGNTWMKWTPELPYEGDYRVYYMQPDGLTDAQSIASAAPYTIHHSWGETKITVNQKQEGGTWQLLGTYTFPKEGGYVKLSTTVSENNTLADAVKFEYVPENVVVDNTDAARAGDWRKGTTRKPYFGENYEVGIRDETGETWMEWTPELKASGYYQVQILHPDGTAAGASVATDAHYVVNHAGGTEELRVSQVTKGTDFETIGTYYFKAGTSGSVKVITDISEGANNTFGDAVRFMYAGRENNESVEIVVDNTEAKGDIDSDGWHTSTYRSGYYGEDYLTAVTGETQKKLVYTPDIPMTGNYAVYYYMPAGDATDVPYEIRHGEGMTVAKVDQKAANAGEWNYIGIYPFEEGNSGSVTVLNEGDSENILSDAIKFVYADSKIGLDKLNRSGEWKEMSEEDAEWTETTENGASFSFQYMPEYTGYHTIDLDIPASVENLSSKVTVACGEETFDVNLEANGSGRCRTGAFYMEEGETCAVSVTNNSEGALAIERVVIGCTGCDLMYAGGERNFNIDEWTISGDGNWEIKNGVLSGTNGEIHQLKNDWMNAQIDAEISMDDIMENASCGMILSGSNNTYLKLIYTPENECFTLYNYQTEKLLATSASVKLEEGTSYNLSADFSYPDLYLSVNGERIMTLELARDGEIGFFTQNMKMNVSMLHARSTTGLAMTDGSYKVNLDEPRQTIWGLGIEVQSDSIGSGNNGLPEETTSAPHDLVQSERERLYSEMLSGFRYLRLAGGLYYRGTDEEQKHLQERWDTQDEELAELIEKSGIEGIDFEFWSPTPYFKSSNSYITTDSKNTLKCFDSSFTGDKQEFLQEFADTVKEDLQALQAKGIPVLQFGLQNEAPHKVNSYSHCHYDAQPYYETMKTVIPTLKEAFPNLHVQADSWNGQYSNGSKKIIQDKELLNMIDAWTFHRIGYSSDDQINNANYYNSNKGRDDIVVYNNEFEYFGSASDWNCINTAQSIMNWMTFENSPTWHWLHMLKPLGNSEASGFSLGFWRALGDEQDRGNYDYLQEGYWDYNYQNWNSIRGFLKYMPWDSVRYDVTEDEVRTDQRIMAYKTPEGRLVIVLTNRSKNSAFTFNINTGTNAAFRGYRYTPRDKEELEMGIQSGTNISPTLAPLSIEFWVQDADETMVMADGISMDETEAELAVNESVQLNAVVTPENAANKNVTWTSDDFTVASVDENGKVTALKEGETTITAMAVSGSGKYRAECTVKVQGTAEEPEGPVLQVSFDEDNADDASEAKNNGTVVGNPEFTEGVKGKAIHLVNSEDENSEALQYVNFGQPDSLKFGKGSFSTMFWYKSEADCVAEGAIIGNKYWDSGANSGFTIGDMKEGITLNMNTPGGSRKDTGRYRAATDGNWHHIAAVFDRTDSKKMTLYIDGEKVEDTSIAALTGSVDVTDFVLGASNKEDGTKFLALEDAYIDELYVFNYAISQDDIRQEVNMGKAVQELSEMEKRVSRITPGERYSAESIEGIKTELKAAKAELAKPEADCVAVMSEMNETYETFMDGNPADMSFHLVSDTHVSQDAQGAAAQNLKTGLQDMKTINPDASAFVTAGDNTQSGTGEQMGVFYNIMDAYNPVGDEQTLIALGNHDVRGPNSGDWEAAPTEPNVYWNTIYNLYMDKNRRYMPETDGAVYYDRWIDGYHFIVLNAENSAKDTAWMTDAQLSWLEEKLAEGEDTQKPVFVIVHQALNDSHYRSNDYLGFGSQDTKIKNILKKYPQTVFISGHIHNGFGVAEVMDSQYGTLVDVPAFSNSETGLTGNGTGYEVYVYETEIYLRARDFINHKWIPEYDVSVRIPSLPVLCRQADGLNQADYTEESWQEAEEALRKILPDVQAMLKKTYGNYDAETRFEINRIQEEMENALRLLVKAEPEVNKDALKAVLDMVQVLTKEAYTAETWEILEQAVSDAQAVYGNTAASEEEVAAQITTLTEAVRGLKVHGDAEYQELRNLLNDKEKELENKSGQLEDKEGELALVQAAVESLTQERDDAKASIEELQERLEELNDEIDRLELDAGEKDEKLEELKNQAEDLQDQISKAGETVNELNSQLDAARTQLTTLENEKLLLESEKAALTVERDAIKAEFEQQEEQYRKMQQEYQEAKAELEKTQEELKRLALKQEETVKAGQVYDSGNYSYKILSPEEQTVEVVGVKKPELTKVTVYDKVTLAGKSYRVTAIGASAFKNNTKVKSVVIGKNVKSVGSSAFAGCTGLRKVHAKSTKLEKIGSSAFSGCRKLQKITIKSKALKKVGKSAFKNINKKAVISVPKAKKKAYIKLLKNKGQKKTVVIK